MSTSLSTMIRLRGIQNKIKELFQGMDDDTYRSQFHPDLSPIGWHLGHCMFIENYWLHEVIQKDDSLTAKFHNLYIPENYPKPERGPQLPKLKDLLSQVQEQQDENDIMLIEMIPPLSDHKLFQHEYIENFLIQHHAQHFETMNMILNQAALKVHQDNYQPKNILKPNTINTQHELIDAGEYEIGEDIPMAYDNEQPKFITHIESFKIASQPVSNAEYLKFIEDGGYQDQSLWSEEGWQWKQEHNIEHPEHWRKNNNQQWFGIKHQGPFDLAADEPVYGICYYEASAFAKWAKARLPHEYEWETSAKQSRLHNSGLVWEWCNNIFFPYDGFKAFPYDGYSKPWFDDKHYVIRGASQYTRPEIRRASFRNFYNADKRHIFAGLRLVFD